MGDIHLASPEDRETCYPYRMTKYYWITDERLQDIEEDALHLTQFGDEVPEWHGLTVKNVVDGALELLEEDRRFRQVMWQTGLAPRPKKEPPPYNR